MLDEPRRNYGSDASELVDSLPGLARVAASMWWHTAGWAMQTSVGLGGRLVQAASSPQEAAALARDGRRTLAEVLRGVSDLVDQRRGHSDYQDGFADELEPVPNDEEPSSPDGIRRGLAQQVTADALRERGRQLLDQSRDVNYESDAHPAYERILDELAPDEARILLVLLIEGPQPSVDIRTGGPVGMVKSRLVAPGLTMVGARAGARYLDRVPAYLNNLFRLGLVWFSREQVPDSMRYQLLEAQPDVAAAMGQVSHAKVVRRSIHLTPFGEDFCRICLAPDTMLLEELPEHALPPSLSEGQDPAPEV